VHPMTRHRAPRTTRRLGTILAMLAAAVALAGFSAPASAAGPAITIPAGETATISNVSFSACNALEYGYHTNPGTVIGVPYPVASKPAGCATPSVSGTTIAPVGTTRTLIIRLRDVTCAGSSGTGTSAFNFFSGGGPSTGDHALVTQPTPASWTVDITDGAVGCTTPNTVQRLPSAVGSGNLSLLVTLNADLSLTKTDSPDPVSVGQPLTYTLTAANAGPNTATGVQIVDTLPANVTFVSASPGCVVGPPGTVTCTIGTLANGASAPRTITVTPTAAASPSITNSATVSGNEPDPTSGNNTATATTSVTPAANLSITKSASPAPVIPGNPITYTLTINNAGPSAAVNLTVTDTLPAGVGTPTVTSPGGFSCATQAAPPQLTCTMASLAAGATATIIYTAPVSPDLGPGVALTNSANVGSDTADPDTANNSTTATTATSSCTIDFRTASGPRFIQGTQGPDVICGSNFADSINGLGGSDVVFAGGGDDTVLGGLGDDALFG
jgi:uncharacterized repeat protein (TIGR01451 family)